MLIILTLQESFVSQSLNCTNGYVSNNKCICPQNYLYDFISESCVQFELQKVSEQILFLQHKMDFQQQLLTKIVDKLGLQSEIDADIEKSKEQVSEGLEDLKEAFQQSEEQIPVEDDSASDDVSCDSIISARGMDIQFCSRIQNVFNLKLSSETSFTHFNARIFVKTVKVANVIIDSAVNTNASFSVFGLSMNNNLTLLNNKFNLRLNFQAVQAALLCEQCSLLAQISQFTFLGAATNISGLVLNGLDFVELHSCFVQQRLFGENIGAFVLVISNYLRFFNLYDTNTTCMMRSFLNVNGYIGYIASICSVENQTVVLSGASFCVQGDVQNVGRGHLSNYLNGEWEQFTCTQMCEHVDQIFFLGLCVNDSSEQVTEQTQVPSTSSEQSCSNQLAGQFQVTYCNKLTNAYHLTVKQNISASYLFMYVQKSARVIINSTVKSSDFSVFGFSLTLLRLQGVQFNVSVQPMVLNASLICNQCNLRLNESELVFQAQGTNVNLVYKPLLTIILNNVFIQERLFGENLGGVIGYISDIITFQMLSVNMSLLLRPFYNENGVIGYLTSASAVEQYVKLSQVSLCMAGSFNNVGQGVLHNIIAEEYEQVSCADMCNKNKQYFVLGFCQDQEDPEFVIQEVIRPKIE
ncbi:Hypothetical_protein [Hexamita inflata]|uniref:Hypothetical_protein n=1 Tax=Hexamita inflata TaxID=28002 RepID=A0AA86PCG7_9EUKA|nr:Hypothetical protein HINF_LOCUS22538 [Hexamita inflata]